jgi:iron complex transport system substrate-binding protein
VRRSDRLKHLATAAVVAVAGTAAEAEPPAASAPERVVSINLCTDQLAMMLAAPGQLVSVSHLATDPRSSAMAEEAAAYPANHARAEEIYLMDPDLVLAGAYTAKATVGMLTRMGIEVEVFQPAFGLDAVPERIAQMGAALGREGAAADLAASFEARLDALAADAPGPRAALYGANGYTSGDRSLAGEILAAAGFTNIATEYGMSGGGRLPLELLVLSDPALVISGEPYPGASRAEAILDHPLVEALQDRVEGTVMQDRAWICGTPHVLGVVEDLADLRTRVEAR